MDFNFKTSAEFNDHFKDEKTCYQFLESLRWNGNPICPHCGSTKKPYTVQPRGKFKYIPSYRCSERLCDLPFTVRTGSIFEGSKVELRKWFQASYEITISKKGISSVELGIRIGVSQKTAWFMNHRLRAVLKDTSPVLLVGEVESDETYIGGIEAKKHKNKRKLNGATGASGKSPIVGLLQRSGKVVLKVIDIDSANGATIKPIVRETVSKDATLITDGSSVYKDLNKEFKEHGIVHHNTGEFVRGLLHTNTIEGFWSILKRGIIGTFHTVSHKHLQRYCDEFSYRYNHRDLTNVGKFVANMKNCDNARLTYDALTANK